MKDINCWQSKFKPCAYSNALLDKLSLINKQAKDKIDLLEIKKAIYYVRKYHRAQMRQSGEPYYTHPLAVAEMVAPHCFKTGILVTSILHDTIEDTELTKDMLEYIFDSNIANWVEDLTRIKFDRKISSAELIERLWLQKKKELLLIKLFDRAHNMQTINIKSQEKMKKTIYETLVTFLPIAASLAFFQIEEIFNELCFTANAKNKKFILSHEQVKFSAFDECWSTSSLSLAFQSVQQPT